MITTTSRTLLATLAFAFASGCAAELAAPDPDADEPPVDEPDAPDQPPPMLAAGEPDPSFGTGGVKQLALGAGYASSLVTQGDKLLACVTAVEGANWTIKVARIDANGDLDPTFAADGVLEIPQTNYNVTCRSLSVRADGSFVVAGRVLGGNGDGINVWSSDGKTRYKLLGYEAGISKASAGADQTLFAVGRKASSLSVSTVTANGETTSVAPPSIEGTMTRAFHRADVGRVAVGSLGESGSYYWGVLQQSLADAYKLEGNGATTQSAFPGADLMTDAIELPDGSMFAVGGVGTGQGVRVARFVIGDAPSVTDEDHPHGGPSIAYGVTLDAEDRPIVVGSARDGGAQVFGWQRYEAASTNLDPTYQIEGLAKLAPPSGQGELVAAARLGDKIYMLGQYDVETSTPHLALVRIHE